MLISPLSAHKKNLGIEDYDVGKRLKPSKNPPIPGLDNSKPKIFPWRPKQILWVIQDHPTKLKEEDVGRKLKSTNDPPMASLNNSRPKLFPWRPHNG